MITEQRIDRDVLSVALGGIEITDSPYHGYLRVAVGDSTADFRIDSLGHDTEGMLGIIDGVGLKGNKFAGAVAPVGYSMSVAEGADLWKVDLPASTYRLVVRPHGDPGAVGLPVVTACRTPMDRVILIDLYADLLEGAAK
jgi:hypothetical protein